MLRFVAGRSSGDFIAQLHKSPARVHHQYIRHARDFKTLSQEVAVASTEEAAKKKKPNLSELRRLVGLARGEASTIAAAIVLLAISSGVTLSVPFGFGRVIDAIMDTPSGDALDSSSGEPSEEGTGENKAKGEEGSTVTDRLIPIVTLLGVLFVAGGASNAGRIVLIQRTSQRIVARLRKDMFSSILKMETSFFDRRATGELVNRLSSDTVVVGKALSDNVSDGLRSASQGIVATGMMLYMSPALSLTVFSVVPPIAIVSVAYGRFIKKISSRTQDALAGSTAVAEERITNVRVVRAFAMEDKEVAQYGERVDEVYTLAQKEAMARAMFFGSAGLCGNFAMLAVLWHGGHLLDAGVISVGDITAFLLYTVYVGSSITGLASFQAELMKGLGASTRMWEILDAVPPPQEDAIRLDSVQGKVSFKGVAFKYPTRPEAEVLTDLTLNLEPGTVQAIVGASGSGKSTLGSLLLRLYDTDAGTIELDGVDVRDLDAHWLRDQVVGIVSQEPTLFSGTVAENIAYSRPDTPLADIQRAAQAANADKFIEGMPEGYDTMVGERGMSLSGGQRQRIAVARALLKDPKVLVLDEATSALDAESEHLVQEALERLMVGRTVIVIAHRLSTIQSAHSIAVLHEGKIGEIGTYEELAAKEGGLFRRIRDIQHGQYKYLVPTAYSMTAP